MYRRPLSGLAALLVACLATTARAESKPTPPKASHASGASNGPSRTSHGRAAANGASGPSGSTRATRTVDASVRRQVAGGPTAEDVALGAESPELRALREAEKELFPPAGPPPGSAWPSELPSPMSAPEGAPLVHASGLPPAPVPSSPPPAEGGRDLSWMSKLELPDLPVRWDPRVVRYLEFFKNDRRGRAILTIWLKRAGRYQDRIRSTLRKKGLPEDLSWLAMIESGFDPTVRSPAGAVGLWQFMDLTGRQYGLGHDRWIDWRMQPEAATEAASDFLSDLHRRFGSWELAMASYNMGYTSVVSVVRKYNTNDFWALSRMEGALPWETTLYVPKIVAAAIVGKNPAVFGFADLKAEDAMAFDEVVVPPATPLAKVASSAGCTAKEVEALNPELRASRTPPADPADPETAVGYSVKVPKGKGEQLAKNLASLKKGLTPLERYVVRFGESLEQVAQAHGTTVAKLDEINSIDPGEVIRGGTVLLVPHGSPSTAVAASSTGAASSASASNAPAASGDLPVVIVPPDVFVYPDRKRVFYRVATGDTLPEIAASFRVTIDEIRRWNDIDPAGRLQDGMTLQLFVPEDADLTHVAFQNENEVRPLAVGTDDFFTYWEGQKNRRRVVVKAKAGDTLVTIGKKYSMSPASLERINRRGRGEKLADGDDVVLYLPQPKNGATASAAPSGSGPAEGSPNDDTPSPDPNGPLPDAPAPSALPVTPSASPSTPSASPGATPGTSPSAKPASPSAS